MDTRAIAERPLHRQIEDLRRVCSAALARCPCLLLALTLALLNPALCVVHCLVAHAHAHTHAHSHSGANRDLAGPLCALDGAASPELLPQALYELTPALLPPAALAAALLAALLDPGRRRPPSCAAQPPTPPPQRPAFS